MPDNFQSKKLKVMEKRVFEDQLNRTVTVTYPPRRIISVVPSQTEFLFDLGLAEEVVGITKFCIHPAEHFKLKTKVGGTKKLNLQYIRSLEPDLIIGNKEENDQEQMETLMQEFPVWMSDISNVEDSLNMMESVGHITGKLEEARVITGKINDQFRELALNNRNSAQRTVYFIWKDPFMVAGRDTFINDIMVRAGWINAIQQSRYPALSAKEINAASPDLIVLSSEPYPFSDKHKEEFQKICPEAKVVIVDGEMFSWYGSRLLAVPPYLQTLSAQMS
jgi:ABC-type Fe3+-hydroxamate transport system substrate-binding protein